MHPRAGRPLPIPSPASNFSFSESTYAGKGRRGLWSLVKRHLVSQLLRLGLKGTGSAIGDVGKATFEVSLPL